MRRRRTQIVVETHEWLSVRPTKRAAPAWCTECAAPSRLLTPDEAAAACLVSTRRVYRMVEANEVHFKEVTGGSVLVCLGSLLSSTARVAGGNS